MNDDIQMLRARLAETTDEAEYDIIQARIVKAEKEAQLAANRKAAEDRAKADGERKVRLDEFRTGCLKIEKQRKDTAKEDEELFLSLQKLYERILARYQREVDLYVRTDELNRIGVELNQPAIDRSRMRICMIDVQGMDQFEAVLAILTQYHLASGQIIDAKKNGVPSPEKPGMDWYGKGDGRFWPRE